MGTTDDALLTVGETLTRCESYDQLVNSFKERVLPAGTKLVKVTEGSMCFTVQADNLKGLITLWNMYQDGTLRSHLFDFLVTAEMKISAGGKKNVKLTVTIDTGEYEKACIELMDEAKGNRMMFTA